jgi:hypothetical protein
MLKLTFCEKQVFGISAFLVQGDTVIAGSSGTKVAVIRDARQTEASSLWKQSSLKSQQRVSLAKPWKEPFHLRQMEVATATALPPKSTPD